MNIYRFEFVSRCPSDGEQIEYYCEIKTAEVIMVERLHDAVPQEAYQEAIADTFYALFGGEQKMLAVHQGVEIQTIRP